MAIRAGTAKRTFRAIVLAWLATSCSSGPVTPTTRDIYMTPGHAREIIFDVTPPPMAPRYEPIDIVFVFDGTSSMGGVIGAVQSSAAGILTDIAGRSRDVRYSVIEFGDYAQLEGGRGGSPPDVGRPVWRLVQDFTNDTIAVQNAIAAVGVHWDGGDIDEAYLRALEEARSLRWRANATRYVILLGDAPARSPDPGRDEVFGTADDLTPQTISASYRRDKISLIGIYSSKTWIGADPVATSFSELATPTPRGMALPLKRDGDVRDAIRHGFVEIAPPPPAMVLTNKDFRSWSGDPVRRQTSARTPAYNFRFKITPPPRTNDGIYHLKFDALSWPSQPSSAFGSADVIIRIGWKYYPLKPLIMLPLLLVCLLGFLVAMRMRRVSQHWGLLFGGRAMREAIATVGCAILVGAIGTYAYIRIPGDVHSLLLRLERHVVTDDRSVRTPAEKAGGDVSPASLRRSL